MKVLSRSFNVDGRRGEIQIDLYADTHLGSKSVDEKLLKAHIKETQETGRYWAHLGDAIDGIIPGDKRWDKKNVSDWAWSEVKNNRLIAAEWDRFNELFSPIKDKCLFVLDGDGKHNQYGNIEDCMTKTLNAMAVPCGDVYCKYLFKFRRAKTNGKKIEITFQHIGPTGRTAGAKPIYLDRALGENSFSLGFFCAHGHTKVSTAPKVSLAVEGNRVVEIIRRAAMTGGYVRTYSYDTVGYGERRCLPPVALGRITLILRPFHCLAEKIIEVVNL